MTEDRSDRPRVSQPTGPPTNGFSGTVGSLPLVDLLQVEALNRYSGLLGVTAGEHSGRVYFAEGEIVHAEAAGHTGEAAMCAMVGWPKGRFELAPQTSTPHRTIHKSFNHLMLDCHRLLDESRRVPVARATPRPSAPAPLPLPPPRPTAPEARAGLLERVKALKGVVRLVHTGKDGRPSDDSPEAGDLAARGLYVSLTHATLLSDAFGLGTLVTATVSGDESFIVTHSNGNHLMVAVAPGQSVASLEVQVRQILTRPGVR
ncbi:MAG: DUF4388 domain-containing protein [Archangium sp.]|nr:DUF4388 domain-containing protein [Archangium sp.]